MTRLNQTVADLLRDVTLGRTTAAHSRPIYADTTPELAAEDELTSPLLPGFALALSSLFTD